MEFLSLTGQVMFAAFLAGSQFVEPLRTEYVTAVQERRPVQDWEARVYSFQPVSLGELYSFSNEELAQYIRTSCLGILDQMESEETRNEGGHFLPDISDTIINIVDPVEVLQKQEDLIETDFVLKDSFEFIIRACDRDFPLEFLSQFNLRQAVDRYASFYNEVPSWETADELPKLPEVSFVRDLDDNIIGEFNKVDTIKIDGEIETVRINRRLIVDDIPLLLKQAIVSVEDAKFWNFEPEGTASYKGHKGVVFKSFFRAGQTSVSSDGIQGGSTITMQLAKNLILYNDVHIEHRNKKRSMFRKVRELILSHRLEEVVASKDEILKLYLNTIDFGRRSQGVEMAARSYFGKSVNELGEESLHEIALLAALPKGPNFYNPGSKNEKVKKRVKNRRDFVLKRMHDEGYITESQKTAAQRKPVEVISGSIKSQEENYAHFYVSQVENELQKRENSIKGVDIKVPIHHELQKMAVEALQKGLLDYEVRHKKLRVRLYEDRLPNIKSRLESLAEKNDSEDLVAFFPEVLEKLKPSQPDVLQFQIGVVLSESEIGLKDGSTFQRPEGERNSKLLKINEENDQPVPLEIWDTVFIQTIPLAGDKYAYRVASTTEVQGGIVVLDIETGDVLATSGGYSIGAGARYKGVEANKAFTAERQPGSTVKPFSYLYGLQAGLKPYTDVSNLRTSFPKRKDGRETLCDVFAPNSNRRANRFLTLEKGLAYSENYATMNMIALAAGARANISENYVSYPQSSDAALSFALENIHLLMERFGVYKNSSFTRTTCYPTILGTQDTTAANMAAAYATIARGGKYIEPKLITEISKNSEPIIDDIDFDDFTISPLLDDESVAERLSTDTHILKGILQGVLREGGTASSISEWSELIAGKTGTTNSSNDTWFVGFNKKVAVAVWVGYVDNKNLIGSGATVALPIFKYFMKSLYEKYPDELQNKLMTHHENVEEIYIEPSTGLVISEDLENLYQRVTGQNAEIPSQLITYVHGRDQSLSYFNGSVSGQLAEFLFTNMSIEKRNDVEVEQSFQMNEIAKVHFPLKQQCENEINQGYRESELSSCRERNNQRVKYNIYKDLRKYFLIYHNLRTWESFR